MQSAPVRFLIGLGYATRSKRLRTTGLVRYSVNLIYCNKNSNFSAKVYKRKHIKSPDAYSAHLKNFLVSMHQDSCQEVRRFAVIKINFLRERSVNYFIPVEDFVGDYLFQDAGKDDYMTSCLPKLNQIFIILVLAPLKCSVSSELAEPIAVTCAKAHSVNLHC